MHFQDKKVLIVGDVGVDSYIHGKCPRLCPEGPVPVFVPQRTEMRLGLAANVALNVATLGGQARVISVVGNDMSGRVLADEFDKANVGFYPVVEFDRPTTLKSRYVSDWHLLLRVDEEQTAPVSESTQSLLVKKIRDHIEWSDIVVVQDYAKGVIVEPVMKALIREAVLTGKEVVVDPNLKQEPSLYYGASYVTPNKAEADEMARRMHLNSYSQVRKTLGLKGLVVTLSADGMAVYQEEDVDTIPAIRREVHDVCGAGDTVTATLALSLANGYPIREAARIANAAASVVVGKFGTSTLNIEELRSVLNG